MNEERSYVVFTEDMIKTHTILVPTMLPMHFKMIIAYLRTYGYKMELLETNGPHIAETGLKYVHNDTCYPAILVIGQLMDAINSGKYDIDKLALVQAKRTRAESSASVSASGAFPSRSSCQTALPPKISPAPVVSTT